MNLFLVGGFLGSGKTTAIRNAAILEMSKGRRIAVITNDQGEDLVDTGFMLGQGIAALEITNGCFCCNYTQLTEAINKLQVSESPHTIFAESVGSCTDLVATIAKPLAKFSPEINVVISVFADAQLFYALINGNASFLDDEVRYIYKKQIEEADILVINKVDLVQSEQVEEIRNNLNKEYSGKELLFQNSLEPGNIEKWLDVLKKTKIQQERLSLDINYDTYAKGEEVLGWVDQRMVIESANLDAYEIAIDLIHLIHQRIKKTGFPVAHLKFLLDADGKKEKFSFTSMASISKISNNTNQDLRTVSLLLNARVQIDFSTLEVLIAGCIAEIRQKTGGEILIQKKAGFQPGYPKPEYRIG